MTGTPLKMLNVKNTPTNLNDLKETPEIQMSLLEDLGILQGATKTTSVGETVKLIHLYIFYGPVSSHSK